MKKRLDFGKVNPIYPEGRRIPKAPGRPRGKDAPVSSFHSMAVVDMNAEQAAARTAELASQWREDHLAELRGE